MASITTVGLRFCCRCVGRRFKNGSIETHQYSQSRIYKQLELTNLREWNYPLISYDQPISILKAFIPVYWRLLLGYIILHEAHCSRKGWPVSYTGEGLPRENQLLAYSINTFDICD